MTIWRNIEYSANINFKRHSIDQSFSELFCGFETKVAAVHIVGKCKRKLSVVEVAWWDPFVQAGKRFLALVKFVVGEPLEEELEGEYFVVVDF